MNAADRAYGGLTAKQTATLVVVEAALVGRKKEALVAIGRDGDVLLNKIGDRRSVALTTADLECATRDPQAVWTHNHPERSERECTALSMPHGYVKGVVSDLTTFLKHNLREVRMVGCCNGEVHTSRIRRERPKLTLTEATDIVNRVRVMAARLHDAGKNVTDTFHVIGQRLNQKGLGFRYDRVPLEQAMLKLFGR